LYELFLLTVPIEEVARCQYKTVLIIIGLFLLNLMTINTALQGGKKGRHYHEASLNIIKTCH